MNIILASSSKRRQELLHWLVREFACAAADINEDAFTKLARTPEELVTKLACAKAKRVALSQAAENSVSPTLIIAADTVVILPQEQGHWQMIGKPKDTQTARDTLNTLRGRSHQVYTGLCLYNSDSAKTLTDYAVSTVTFKHFSDEALVKYVATGSPLDKAGAYGIQEIGDKFVDSFEGSITNIIGFPVHKVAAALEQFGVELTEGWEDRVKKETGYED